MLPYKQPAYMCSNLQTLLISNFDTEGVLVTIFFVIDEDKYFRESTRGGRNKLQSDGHTAVWSDLQQWVLDMHKVRAACTHVKHSGRQVRISIRDLLVVTMATTNGQCHLK